MTLSSIQTAFLQRTCKSLQRNKSTSSHILKFPRKAIEISENEQSQFKELVATSKNFSKTEKAVIEYKTVAEFDTFWQLTNSAKEEFDQSHERGCGLCMRRYQSSAVVAQSFMEDFSPIINIVKSFAAPYGGMAVGTISILFAVGFANFVKPV